MAVPVRFHVGDAAWKRIRAEVRTGPARVAVAWWGQGMTERLPLKRGSILVVRADRATMEQGQTSPDDLAQLVKKGVRVYPLGNLHAKVFVFRTVAFIGSMNASETSFGGDVIEAAVEVVHPRAVVAARRQVEEWAIDRPLTLSDIADLKKFYRPQRSLFGKRRKRRGSAPKPHQLSLPIIRILRTHPADWKSYTQARFRREAPAARREAARDGEVIDDGIEWDSSLPSEDEDARYLEVHNEGDQRWILAPARLRLATKVKPGRPEGLVILSRTEGVRRRRLGKVTKALGPRSRLARLLRGRGQVVKDAEEVRMLLALWQQF